MTLTKKDIQELLHAAISKDLQIGSVDELRKGRSDFARWGTGLILGSRDWVIEQLAVVAASDAVSMTCAPARDYDWQKSKLEGFCIRVQVSIPGNMLAGYYVGRIGDDEYGAFGRGIMEDLRETPLADVRQQGGELNTEALRSKLKILAAVAVADGHVDEKERALLESFCHRCGLDTAELDGLLTSRVTISRKTLPKSREDKLALIVDVLTIAGADGRVDDNERRVVGQIAAGLGLSRDDIKQCATKAAWIARGRPKPSPPATQNPVAAALGGPVPPPLSDDAWAVVAEASEMISRGRAAEAKQLLLDGLCDRDALSAQAVYCAAAERFASDNNPQVAILLYDKCGAVAETNRLAAQLGLVNRVCERHNSKQAVGKCKTCQRCFCRRCGVDVAGGFVCRSCHTASQTRNDDAVADKQAREVPIATSNPESSPGIRNVEVFFETAKWVADARAKGSTFSFVGGGGDVNKQIAAADKALELDGRLEDYAMDKTFDIKTVNEMDDDGWKLLLDARAGGPQWDRFWARTTPGRWNVIVYWARESDKADGPAKEDLWVKYCQYVDIAPGARENDVKSNMRFQFMFVNAAEATRILAGLPAHLEHALKAGSCSFRGLNPDERKYQVGWERVKLTIGEGKALMNHVVAEGGEIYEAFMT